MACTQASLTSAAASMHRIRMGLEVSDAYSVSFPFRENPMTVKLIKRATRLAGSFWRRGGMSVITVACKASKGDDSILATCEKAAELTRPFGTGQSITFKWPGKTVPHDLRRHHCFGRRDRRSRAEGKRLFQLAYPGYPPETR